MNFAIYRRPLTTCALLLSAAQKILRRFCSSIRPWVGGAKLLRHQAATTTPPLPHLQQRHLQHLLRQPHYQQWWRLRRRTSRYLVRFITITIRLEILPEPAVTVVLSGNQHKTGMESGRSDYGDWNWKSFYVMGKMPLNDDQLIQCGMLPR